MRRRRRARLELTPLLDVMFLVLVFFIYCIFDMAVHRGMKVSLPEAKGSAERGERIVVTVGPDDSVELNGIRMSRDEAVARVKALSAVGVQMPVLVSADRRASFGAGVELLAALKEAGVDAASVQVSGRRE
ncbi:MAG: biopolymer transporter ExbD [Kiritimatiellae bacterium]|nr:biopolymer transporter ExbD [Kiritimatiellia bacterium]MBQ3345107.1 biopolymer transporter ExbD [Kiritimatiellia bacterium]MBQ6328980.1 biopolymer transporter ExbD [Kiritimatiellia bacterium]